MRTSQKTNKKKEIRRPEVRTLKIQPKYREQQFETVKVPEIRFSGNWLEKLGFSYGRRVTITTMNELLIVRLQPE
jgi:hypothetical protein